MLLLAGAFGGVSGAAGTFTSTLGFACRQVR